MPLREPSALASLRPDEEGLFVLDRKFIDKLFLIPRTDDPVDVSGPDFWQLDQMIAKAKEQLVFEVANKTITGGNRSVGLYILAQVISSSDGTTRRIALAVLPRIMKSARDVLEFVHYYNSTLRGWSRSTRAAVAAWYLDTPPRILLEECTKCPVWRGWSHKDVMRLAHPKPTDTARHEVLRFIHRLKVDDE